jgi:hypothetical protein
MKTYNTQPVAGASSRAGLFASTSLSPMLRGPMVTHAPENDGGGGQGDGEGQGDPPAPIDPAAHAALAAAHERLKKDAKADRDALAELRTQVEEIQAEKTRVEEEKARASGDVEAVKTQLETKHARELKARDDKIGTLEKQLERLVIDNGLSAALTEVRIKPELAKGAAAMLRDGVEIKDEDGQPVAIKGGLPLLEAIKLWATSDEGKPYVLEGNSGGGANGGAKPSTAKNPWKEGPDFSLTEQDAVTKKDPALASRLKAEAGVA